MTTSITYSSKRFSPSNKVEQPRLAEGGPMRPSGQRARSAASRGCASTASPMPHCSSTPMFAGALSTDARRRGVAQAMASLSRSIASL
jgi:hypothetical protein